MKKILIFLLLVNISFLYSKYHLVRIYLNDEEDFKKLHSLNLDLESASGFKNELSLVANDFEIEEIKRIGLNYFIEVEDYETYLANKIIQYEDKKIENVPLGFQLGSMGGFYKLNEIYTEFDKLCSNYPYTVDIDTIGTSWERNPIIAYCFGSQDTTKPELLITALHHSREPASVTTIVYFLQTLFNKAQTGNLEANYLLQNRRIWVIPVLNPDGYLYNQKNYPSGGGLWRKNRRPINDKDTGVDLNRNYGPYDFWNANNNGSSTNPKNETFRGTAPFSEPEISSLRNFCFSRKFLLAINFHTYGGMLIYPYSALPYETPDSVWYRSFGMYVHQFNSYYFGTDLQTVGYSTRGSSDDWFYTVDSTKGKVLAFSPEAGYQFDSFWPSKDRIVPIAQENFPLLMNFLWSAEENVKLSDYYYYFDTTRKIGFLNLDFQNLGIKPSQDNLKVQIFSLDATYTFNTSFNLEPINPAEKIQKILQLPTPNEKFINGNSVSFVVSIFQNQIERQDTLSVNLYEYHLIDLKDSSFWDFSSSHWGYTEDNESNTILLCDSPFSNYKDSVDNHLYFGKPFRLNGNNFDLEIQSRWSIEPFYDFAKVELSINNGKDWYPLRFKRSTIASGNPYGKQKLGEYGFAGYFSKWITQSANLKEYLWKDILIRLSMLSDRAKNSSGIDIKEIRFRKYPNIDFKNYSFVQDSNFAFTIYFNGFPMKNFFLPNYFQIEEVKLYDFLGRVLSCWRNLELNNSIHITNLPLGVYFISIKNTKGYFFEKLILW